MEFSPLNVDFNPPSNDSWFAFYHEYIDELEKPEEGHKVKLKCIHHDDTNPSAFIDLKTGVYFCSVCGTFTPYRFLVDIIGEEIPKARAKLSAYKETMGKVAQGKYHLDVGKALQAPMVGLTPIVRKAAAEIELHQSITEAYMESRGLSFNTLQDWEIGYLAEDKETGQEECLIFPYYFDGEIATIKGRTIDGRKGAPKQSKLVPFGLQFLKKATYAIVCEGETDTLCTYQALKTHNKLDGVAVIGVPGANNFKKEWKRFFQHIQQIYIIPQADEASESMINQVRHVLGHDRTKIIELSWSFTDIGKDISDWISQHSEKEFVELLPPFVKPRPFVMTTEDFISMADNEINWIIPGFIAASEVVMIGGAPKSYKTILTIDMMRAIAQGKPVWGNEAWTPTAPKKVLFVEEEGNPVLFARRIKRNFNGTSEGWENIRWIHKQNVRVDSEHSLKKLQETIEDFIPDIIVFDPFKSLHNADENDNTAMGKVWATISEELIARFPQAAHLYIHHIPKAEKGKKLSIASLRGASATGAFIDSFIGIRQADFEKDDPDEIAVLAAIEGREIAGISGEMIIKIDNISFRAKIDGFKSKLTPQKQKEFNTETIFSYLTKTGKRLTITELADETQLTEAQVRAAVKPLLTDNKLQKGKGESTAGRPPTVYWA